MRNDVRLAFFTSPFGGEVDTLGSDEGGFPTRLTKKRPPHPALRADLSPEGRGEGCPS